MSTGCSKSKSPRAWLNTAPEILEEGALYKVTTRRLFGPRETTKVDISDVYRLNEGTVVSCSHFFREHGASLVSFLIEDGGDDYVIEFTTKSRRVPSYLIKLSPLEALAKAAE